MQEQNEVHLKITSTTMSPQDLETSIGIKASDSWRLGDRQGVFGASARESGVLIDSGLPGFSSWENCLSALLRKIEPQAVKIGALAGKCQIDVVCTLRQKAYPVLHFEAADLRLLGAVGARLNVDCFVLSDAGTRASAGAKRSGESGAGTKALDY